MRTRDRNGHVIIIPSREVRKEECGEDGRALTTVNMVSTLKDTKIKFNFGDIFYRLLHIFTVLQKWNCDTVSPDFDIRTVGSEVTKAKKEVIKVKRLTKRRRIKTTPKEDVSR